jgi:L,D-transpeptidase ErfK/SrfK
MVPPGPDNPLGRYALYLGWPEYAIHGTNRPWGVGRRVSRGCIRLYPEHIEELYAKAGVGTQVTVVDQPVKLAWEHGDLYLEIHASRAQLDILEETNHLPPEQLGDLEEQVVAAAGAEVARIDWSIVRQAERQRRGMPVPITR